MTTKKKIVFKMWEVINAVETLLLLYIYNEIITKSSVAT